MLPNLQALITMKWIHLPLISLLLCWASILFTERPYSIYTTSSSTHWIVRFNASEFSPSIPWPSEIVQTSIHQPIHAVTISSGLSDEELEKLVLKTKGVIRLEKADFDNQHSIVYPTGMALIEPTSNEAFNFLKTRFNIEPKQTLESLGWLVVEIPIESSFEEFRSECIQSGTIKEIHRDEVVTCLQHQTNDPMYASSWHIQQNSDADIDAPQAWALLPASAPVRSIAIIEGVGFDTLNADLSGRFIDRFNAVDNTTNVYSNTTNERHGTATCGIPCAIANNALSAAGLGYNKLRIQAIRLGYNVTTSGNFTTTSVMQAAAVNRAIGLSSTVAISMSFGSSSYQTAFYNAITSARLQGRNSKGIPVFASTGNSGLSAWTNYPASYSGVIAVGSTTSSDARSSFSNFGPGITLSAPGSSIATTDITGAEGYNTGDNTYFSGTSASCPVAASVGALMIVANDQITEAQVKQYMAQSCDKVGGFSYNNNNNYPHSTWCSELGYGRVNMHTAIQLCVAQNTALPDLSTISATVSTTNPGIGQSITINAIQQIAPATGSAVFPVLEYRYSNDAVWSSDDIVIGTDASTLGGGISSESENINYTIPSGTGTKYILIRADAQSAVSESNENNNTVSIALTLPAASNLPDVVITNATASATSVVVGQSITINCTQTITTATSTLYPSVQYRLSSDAIWQTTDTYIGSDVSTLSSAITSEAENISYVIPNSIGTRYILIKADAGSAVSESNENNNVAIIPITIAAAATLPDVQASNITISSSNAIAGQSIVISCRHEITNPGATGYPVQMQFRWSSDAILTSDDLLLGSANATLSPLSLYELETISFAAPNVSPGSYYVLIVADAANTVMESNEANNLASVAFSLANNPALPDVGITNATVSNSTATAGSSITVSCLQYVSLSSIPAADVLLQYRWGTSPTYSSTYQLLGIDYSSLGGSDADDPEDFTFPIPTGAGQRYLFLIADVNNVISESNESNNIVVIPINVVSAFPEESGDTEKLPAQLKSDEIIPTVFPNPAHSFIRIDSQGFDWSQLTIFDVRGSIVEQVTGSEYDSNKELDISRLPAGIYLLRLEDNSSTRSCRLIIE
jgi:hypothetical protein